MASHVDTNDVEAIMKGSEAAKASDYANYFSSYAFIYHQKQMLSDGARMRAYRDAILGNPECFAGKVVLDVGAGSGILSMWAAQAGAKRVIACEFTKMADHAEALVAANGLQDVVEVRRSAAETLDLKKGDVDVIVSEWMGYFLLRESMLDSVIYARDHYLKDGGALFPNRAALFWAPASLHGARPRGRRPASRDVGAARQHGQRSLGPTDVDVRTDRSLPSSARRAAEARPSERSTTRASKPGRRCESHAGERDVKLAEKADAMADWDAFQDATRADFGVDVSVLRAPYVAEQDDYYLRPAARHGAAGPGDPRRASARASSVDVDVRTRRRRPSSARGGGRRVRRTPSPGARAAVGSKMRAPRRRQAHWMEMRDDMLAAPPARIGVIDLNTCTLAESRGIEDAPFRFPVPLDRCAAFAGWFDTYFEGSPSCPAKNPVTLSTSPADGYTHWGQQVFFVPPAKVEAAVADAGGHPRGPSSTVGTISLRRQKEAVRLYNIAVKLEVVPDDPTTLDLDWELS